MNRCNEIEYLDECINQINQRISNEKKKIERIREEFDIEPQYELQVLKRLYAKKYSLIYKKERISYENK